MQSVERVASGAVVTERTRKDEIKEVVNQDMDRMARCGGSPGRLLPAAPRGTVG